MKRIIAIATLVLLSTTACTWSGINKDNPEPTNTTTKPLPTLPKNSVGIVLSTVDEANALPVSKDVSCAIGVTDEVAQQLTIKANRKVTRDTQGTYTLIEHTDAKAKQIVITYDPKTWLFVMTCIVHGKKGLGFFLQAEMWTGQQLPLQYGVINKDEDFSLLKIAIKVQEYK